MTIIVTGGAGFIGTNFVKKWISEVTERIINIDCLTYAGNIKNLKGIANNDNYVFHKVRIGNKDAVKQILNDENPRAIINFAAESHVDRSILGPEEFFNTNVIETLSLLNNTKEYFNSLTDTKKNIFKFIHISTDEVYGSLGKEDKPSVEKDPYRPNSPYAASKAASDHLVRSFGKTYELPCIISNCSNNYGPFQYPEKLIPLIVSNALKEKELPIYGTGEQIRDWLHVSDHCDAIIDILEKGKALETYNIGGSNEIKNIELVKLICSNLDKMAPLDNGKFYESLIRFVKDRPGHDTRYAINSNKIMKDLNWKPKIPFEVGLVETIKWYIKNDYWLEDIQNKSYDGWINKNYENR